MSQMEEKNLRSIEAKDSLLNNRQSDHKAKIDDLVASFELA